MATQQEVTLFDGQYNWSRGMDSSVFPAIGDPTSVRMAINTTFRGGRAKTRPGNQQIFLTDDPNYPGSLSLFTTGRDENNIKTGNYFQGAFFYTNKTNPELSCLIACSGGYVFKITPVEGYVARLPVSGLASAFRWDSTTRVYFCQAEKYLIIQNGIDSPLIYDGEDLFQVGVGAPNTTGQIASVPVGTFMAYGQGRLFVVNPSKDSFVAGDLVYGGSSDQTTILASTAAAETVITTNGNHGFVDGDVVTISGHSSTPNISGTWKINFVSNTSFRIPTGVSAAGKGGFVIKANNGDDSDLLRFTETTYLNEGGSFQIPSQMGQIRGFAFQAISDTSTGQGDLLVFGERGAVTFSVAVPREQWKNTPGFMRVALDNIGLVADRTVVAVNNDVYFRSQDGIRSYRHARAQIEGYNLTPLSSEMDAVMDFDTEGLLGASSAVYFDNRLLLTVSPRENYLNIQDEPIQLRPVSFRGIAALDFNGMGVAGNKRPAVWDGVWTGLDVLQLVTGVTKRLPRCFIFSYDVESNSNSLWENYPWALFDFPMGASNRKIQCAIETRAYDFETPYNLKKLERGDIWIGELSGDTMVNVYWRPDENPCWFSWHSFNTCSEYETCIDTVATVNAIAGIQGVPSGIKLVEIATTWKLDFVNPVSEFYVRLGNTRETYREFNTTTQTWQFTTASTLQAALNSALATANPDGTAITCTVTQNANAFTIVFSTAVEAPNVIPAPSVCGVYLPANVKDQYRSQIRLPNPPNDCVTSTKSLAKLGHSYQFRFEWEGQFALTKVMFVASRVIEPIGGTCNG